MQKEEELDKLPNEVKNLKEGEEFKTTDNGQEVTYIRPPKPVICKKHFYKFASHEGEFDAYQCDCGNGIIINPETHKVENGVLTSLVNE